MSEKVVVAALRDGTVGVWRLKSLVEGNVGHVLGARSRNATTDRPRADPSTH